MAESLEYMKNKEGESEPETFVKKFVKIKANHAKELRKKLQELNLLKMREEQISKIIDLLPEDSEDLNKIFVDISLDEDESKKILDTVKQFI
jgi:DNA-directed RNA polymerase subunit F